MNLQTFFTPWNLAGAIAGLVFALALVIALILCRQQVGAWIKTMGEKLFSQVGLFSIVILVFMAISVLESGEFFDQNITHGALFGLLGYALALGFDLVSVVSMLARMSAIRLRDERGARLNLLGVVLCAAVSAFANAAASLQGYNASNLDHTPWWMQQVAPWLGTIFPTMIVVLSLTTDHLLDHRGPSRGIDLVTYRAQEKRRVDMLQIKLDTEKELLNLEAQLSNLRRNRDQAKGRVQREWFFTRWIRPQTTPKLDTIKAEFGQALSEARTTLEQQIGQLATLTAQIQQQVGDLSRGNRNGLSTLSTLFQQQLALLSQANEENLLALRSQFDALAATVATRLSTVDSHISRLDDQLDTLGGQVTDHLSSVDSQLDALTGQMNEQRAHLDKLGNVVAGQMNKALRGQMPVQAERPMSNLSGQSRGQHAEADTGEMESVALEQRVLNTFLKQGIGTSDRQIATQLGCSPTSVGTWRKRLQQRGLLPKDEQALHLVETTA